MDPRRTKGENLVGGDDCDGNPGLTRQSILRAFARAIIITGGDYMDHNQYTGLLPYQAYQEYIADSFLNNPHEQEAADQRSQE